MSVRFIVFLTLFNLASVRAGRVLLTLYAIHLGAHPAVIGMLAAAFSVIPALFSWVSGRWSDRFGSRWLLLIGMAGSSGAMLVPYFLPSLATIFFAAVMSGLSMSFCNVSLQTLVGILSPADQRARNFSNYTLAGSTAAFVGPLIAGFSIDHMGYDVTCLVVLALAGVPIAMLLQYGAALPRGSGKAHPTGSLLHTLAVPGVGRALAASSVSQIGTDLFQFYMPVYAHAAGLSPSAIGIVLAGYSAASFVVRFALPRLIAGAREEKVLAYAFGLGAAGYLLVPAVQNAAVLALVSFVVGLGLGCTGPIAMIMMYASSPEGRSGEAMGLRLTADNLTRLVGPVLFGLIASGIGLAAVFWLNAAMLGSGSLLAHRGHRVSMRRDR